MQNFLMKTGVPSVLKSLLVFLVLFQNHCGLMVIASHFTHSGVQNSISMPSCHQMPASKKSEGKACEDGVCCTHIQAIMNAQDMKLLIQSLSHLIQPAAFRPLTDVKIPAQFSKEILSPPHLSLHECFYKESFPSHAPPASLLA